MDFCQVYSIRTEQDNAKRRESEKKILSLQLRQKLEPDGASKLFASLPHR